MEKIERFESFEQMLDYGYIRSMRRSQLHSVWDETGYYHVVFWDGTQHDFYDSDDIVRFANYLLQFYNDNN